MTTNFDRLLETALETAGIILVVIASPDGAQGAPPLAHSKCTLIKVNGNYLDYRIKNSPAALATYDSETNRLLDQIFDEYGIIISGWSSEYDIALRAALERTRSRRYPLYWTSRGEPQGSAKALIALHGAHIVRIDTADSFFQSIWEKTQALEEFSRPHPLSVQAAVATLKRNLSEDKHRIQLRDFLLDEAERASTALELAYAKIGGVSPNPQTANELLNNVEAGCEQLIHIFANGSFYSRKEHAKAFFDAFEFITPIAQSSGGYTVWVDLRRYPILLLIYAVGLTALASENFSILREISTRTVVVKHSTHESGPVPLGYYTHSVMPQEIAQRFIPGMERHHTPVSDHLFNILRQPLIRLLPIDSQYERVFADFEYLWCLLHVDAEKQRGSDHIWAPYGSFMWRWERGGIKDNYFNQTKVVIEKVDTNWPPLQGGLFGGDVNRLKSAKELADPILQKKITL